MPMPAANSPWPPEAWADAYAQYAENDAWLTGDTDALAKMYGGQGVTHSRASISHHGGFLGAMSRAFWGRPAPANEGRTHLHPPLPADLATLTSDLQYSNPAETSIAGDKVPEAAQERVDMIMNSDEHHAMLNSMGEVKSALDATEIIPRWDTKREDHVWLDYAAADCIIPTFRHGRLVEVTLWSEWLDSNIY